MPKDINGMPVRDGDEVLLRAKVIGTAPSDEGPNLVLNLLGGKEGEMAVNVAVNSRMVKKLDESAIVAAPPPAPPPAEPTPIPAPTTPPAAA